MENPKNISATNTNRMKPFLMTLAVSGISVFASVYLMLSSANAPCHNTTPNFSMNDAVSTQHFQRGNADVTALCNRDNQQISWVTWFFKKPESAQFHFVDLLELLNRNQ
jgi:hypothetical protein